MNEAAYDWRRAWIKQKIRSKRVAAKTGIKFHLVHMGGDTRQSNYALAATGHKDNYLGHLDFSTYGNDSHVQMLSVDPQHRRKGVGSLLLKELHHRHKKELGLTGKIHYGYSTEDGAKLLASKKVPFGKKPKPYQNPYKRYIEADEWLDKERRHERMQWFTHLLGSKLQKKHGAMNVTLAQPNHQKPRNVHLDTLVVPRGSRKRGVGSAILKDLNKHADRHKLLLTLTLADRNKEWGTTSSNRLRKFYGRSGWKNNRGRNKRFEISAFADMYREPKSKG